MKSSLVLGVLVVLFVTHFVEFKVEAAPAGPLIRHLSSLIKWSTRSSPKAPQTDGNFLQFENGYLVETVVEGNELGVVPHSIRVSREGELFAVDAAKSNIVRITPPLSQYSRARLVAGSFQGYKGHVDGKPSDARFNYPKGVTMDDKGNVYVADTLNLAIRKIGETGVTTIAGGKSNVAGYRDGPSEDAKFSSDFDVVYVGRTCSLLVVDRGNAAIRQIALNEEDCDFQHSSISTTDIFMVIGAVLVGYISCMIQQGFGPLYFSRMRQVAEAKIQDQPVKEKPIPLENLKDDQDAGWPSFGRLIADLSKLAVEALGSVFLYLIPFNYRTGGPKNGLTPLRDSLVLPEDKAETPPVQKQRTAAPVSETHHAPPSTATVTATATNSYTPHKHHRSKSVSLKDPSLSSKHRSSKRQEYAEFYGSGEAPAQYSHIGSKSQKEQQFSQFGSKSQREQQYSQSGSKSQKERTRHRHRERTGETRNAGEAAFGAAATDAKPAEPKQVDYNESKYDPYNIRSKYNPDDLFNF
ncbi:hypothetical protein Scep_011708 [Stephania cephalantha]|uniref:NHL repeat-containing protein n=1 Tax=Stephania cephalantha TaxID=152367 RepID=A0AAP0JFT7_9MAGN